LATPPPPLKDAGRDLRVVADRLDHTEGVSWNSGHLWAGSEAGDLLRIDPVTGVAEVVAKTGGELLGLAFDAAGRCYVCDAGLGRVLRITPGGAVETYVEAVEGRRLVNPNYPAFASDGTLWVTASGQWGADDGFLFRVRPGAEPEIASDVCGSFPNGIAFAPGERALYVIESRTARVLAFPHSAGSLSDPSTFVTLPFTVPDGLAVDEAGTVYVTCFQPNRVYRVYSGGRPELLLDDWSGIYLLAPTNGCFGGTGLTTLFLTSLGSHTISAIDVEVPGLPLPAPDL
jgi:sugar lactone lactonase YvrE